ncbi:NDR1/HIN1-like protein 10 [Phragmites australis]|uniref:NDR1/HIN1-like protein 10 n=1 Tax=Phragmites australis TaxID=29695 RepID=UPI002D796B46|nr:NDR1/HIN1-like protein 10 [Phragmites australis]
MCGCCDDCGERVCCCIPYHVRENIKSCLILLAVVVVLAVIAAIVIVALVFGGPLRKVQITVEDASLTRFALVSTPTTALAYNLSIRLTVRNPNWAIAIKHDKPLEAAYSFDGQQFDRAKVADKGDKQGARKTVVYRLDTNSDGRSVALGNAGEAEFKKENATGVFEVEVKLTGKFKYTLRKTKCNIVATCPLKLQLAPPGTPALVFQKVKCKPEKQENKYC